MSFKKKVTLDTIARQLGISPITVSKALRDRPDVSPGTTARVKSLAQKLGYEHKSTVHDQPLLGVLLPEFDSSVYGKAIKAVNDFALANGYKVVVMVDNQDLSKDSQVLDIFVRFQVKGLLAAVLSDKDILEPLDRLKDSGIPVVLWKRSFSDDRSGYQLGKKAVEILLDSMRTRNRGSDPVVVKL